jgi:hypothetical protein
MDLIAVVADRQPDDVPISHDLHIDPGDVPSVPERVRH